MDDSKLIELVREYSSLYNPKHPQYKDSNIRDNVWAEIAGVIKIPVEECKNRWKNIRDTYMRRKRSKKLPTGSARSKGLRKWYLEEHLQFLNLVEFERETLSNTQREIQETQPDDIDHGTQNTEMEEHLNDPENHIIETLGVNNTGNISIITEQQSELVTMNKPSNKRKPDSKISSQNIVQLFKKNSDDRAKLLSTILAKQPERHPVDVFFQSMAMSVKKLSAENQIRAKMDICQIVGQLELEEIRKTSSSSSSAQYDLLSPIPAPSQGSSVSQQSPSPLQDDDMEFSTNVTGYKFH